MCATLALVTLHDLRTPCVLIDWVRAERNIVADAGGGDGERPTPAAARQDTQVARARAAAVARGAVGICCAKLGEAEVFAQAGIEDIRLPYPLNPVERARVLALLDRARLSFIVDHPDVARGWSDAMRGRAREVDVLVKVDVGLPSVRHRSGRGGRGGLRGPGRRPARAAVQGAAEPRRTWRTARCRLPRRRAIAAAEASMLLRSGGAASRRSACRARRSASARRRPPASACSIEGITELRPGNYIYFDRTQVALGAAAWDDCALTRARARRQPAGGGRLILDSGSKTLTNDLARGFGRHRGYGVGDARRSTSAEPDAARRSSACRKSTRTCGSAASRRWHRRPGAHRPESLLRGVEPRGRGLAGGRR